MAEGGGLTKAVKLRRVEAVINPLAGSVGPQALDEMKALLEGFGLDAKVEAIAPGGLDKALDLALSHNPDLLIILAGDGTARAACELAGERGPLIAPLPGGTMNVLPKALYGSRDWKTALTDTLAAGEVRSVSGGEVDGRRFYVAAMLGWPALWARAREAARERKAQLALLRAQNAWRHAFGSRVRFRLDGGAEQRAHALTFLCPLVSKEMTEEKALEVAALNPSGLVDAARVGVRALVGDIFGAWREDPAVDMGECRKAVVRGVGGIPAFLDGEPVRLGTTAEIKFRPKAFRCLAPAGEERRV